MLRWKYLESRFFFRYFIVAVVEARRAIGMEPLHSEYRYAIAFHIMRQNWPTGTCVEYDLWAHWIGVGGELRTYGCMLWAKWWPVFTTYYGCGLSRYNKLCVYVPYFYCWRYLLPIFVFLILCFTFAPNHNKPLLPIALCDRFKCILIHFQIYSRLHFRVQYEWMCETKRCDVR